ncbi:MAG: T9SS type A sorting domain-containing protein, partial [Lewinella sp.]|nr:T9SS type A sorting domain-containing protein [Lewinella sp.]
HAFELRAQDACGNGTSVTIPFSVVDCYIPDPVCFSGLIVNLEALPPMTDIDGDGEADEAGVMVFANELASCEVIECSAPLHFSVNRVGEQPDINQTSIALTCDDRYSVELEVYVWDSAGNPYAVQPDGTIGGPNYKHCTVEVLVQDPNHFCNNCEEQMQLAGSINTSADLPVTAVDVTIEGSYTETTATLEAGTFTFSDVLPNGDYVIRPEKDGDDLNGVTTLDVILIQAHILNQQPLSDAYQRIAADANNSGTITMLDVIELRRLLLGDISSLTNNTSWRFVAADYVFPNPANPWAEVFPETITVDDPVDCQFGLDFVAIKIGDVNGTVTVNGFATGDERTGHLSWPVMMEDALLQAGETYELPLRAQDLAVVDGFQFTLDVDHSLVALTDVRPGLLGADQLGKVLRDRGWLTASWNRTDALPMDEVLFTLVLRPRQTVRASEAITLGSAFTAAEAYTSGNRSLMDVDLHFYQRAAAGMELFQNFPNPLTDQTVIPFTLPREGEATIEIFDWTGRRVLTIRDQFIQGYNQVRIDRAQLQSGVYAYVLRFNGEQLSKEMVVLEK